MGRMWLGAGAGLVAATAVVLLLVRRSPGPLRLADGQALVAVSAPQAGLSLLLSDGSLIALSAGARLQPLESSATTFLTVLQSGRGDFDIRPGGPRRWQVECGLATIEVLGTRFSCTLGPGRLDIAVERGVVLVRGERVPDRAQRLSAGEKMTLRESGPAGPVTGSVTGSATHRLLVTEPSAAPATAPSAASSPPTNDADAWRTLARRGRHREAFAVLGPQGFRRAAKNLGVEGLLSLADVARLSGHPKEAVVPLERILRDYSVDPQAPLAAFELGRVELDALNHPLPAVMAFERALTLGVPASLAEDVQARLVEAYQRAGDTARARVLGNAYLHDHPSGRYRRVMEAQLARMP